MREEDRSMVDDDSIDVFLTTMMMMMMMERLLREVDFQW